MAAPKFGKAPWHSAGRWGRVGVEVRDAEHRTVAIVNRCDAVYDAWLKAHPPPSGDRANSYALIFQHAQALQKIDANVESAEANAKLVVAAPAMYEALRFALAVLSQPVTKRLRAGNSLLDTDLKALEREALAALGEGGAT